MNDTLFPIGTELDIGLAEASKLMHKGAVSACDVGMLRRAVFADRSASRAEIEALFALDRVVRPRCDAWAELLIQVVTDHVVWDARPTGVVTAAEAKWLLRCVDSTRTAAAFAVLVDVLDAAHRLPNWFALAVRQRAVAGWPGVGEAANGGFAEAAYAA